MDHYYSNGMAAVNGYDEAYSAGLDEAFVECEGAIAARLHNAQEAAQLEMEMIEMEAADDCSQCGNLGYTIEINDEGVEYTQGCFECFVAAHEKGAV